MRALRYCGLLLIAARAQFECRCAFGEAVGGLMCRPGESKCARCDAGYELSKCPPSKLGRAGVCCAPMDDDNETTMAPTPGPRPTSQRVVCPGYPPPSYCDCDDCSSFPELCACEAAQTCCADAKNEYESYYFEDDLGPPYDIDACPGGRGQATAPRCLGCVSRSVAQRECADMCAGYYHYQLHNHDIDMCNELCDGEPICRCLCKEIGPIELLEKTNGSLVPDDATIARRSTLGVAIVSTLALFGIGLVLAGLVRLHRHRVVKDPERQGLVKKAPSYLATA